MADPGHLGNTAAEPLLDRFDGKRAADWYRAGRARREAREAARYRAASDRLARAARTFLPADASQDLLGLGGLAPAVDQYIARAVEARLAELRPALLEEILEQVHDALADELPEAVAKLVSRALADQHAASNGFAARGAHDGEA
jgi:hypothetical protein